MTINSNRWSEWEDAIVTECRAQGLSARQAAARLPGRTRGAVIGRWNRLGLPVPESGFVPTYRYVEMEFAGKKYCLGQGVAPVLKALTENDEVCANMLGITQGVLSSRVRSLRKIIAPHTIKHNYFNPGFYRLEIVKARKPMRVPRHMVKPKPEPPSVERPPVVDRDNAWQCRAAGCRGTRQPGRDYCAGHNPVPHRTRDRMHVITETGAVW